MSNANKSFLLRMREAAKGEPDVLHRENLRAVADALDAALGAFTRLPSTANLQTVNGLWVRGERLLKLSNRPPDPPKGAGLRSGAELTEAA